MTEKKTLPELHTEKVFKGKIELERKRAVSRPRTGDGRGNGPRLSVVLGQSVGHGRVSAMETTRKITGTTVVPNLRYGEQFCIISGFGNTK